MAYDWLESWNLNFYDRVAGWENPQKESCTDNPKAVFYANVRFLGKKKLAALK